MLAKRFHDLGSLEYLNCFPNPIEQSFKHSLAHSPRLLRLPIYRSSTGLYKLYVRYSVSLQGVQFESGATIFHLFFRKSTSSQKLEVKKLSSDKINTCGQQCAMLLYNNLRRFKTNGRKNWPELARANFLQQVSHFQFDLPHHFIVTIALSENLRHFIL